MMLNISSFEAIVLLYMVDGSLIPSLGFFFCRFQDRLPCDATNLSYQINNTSLYGGKFIHAKS